MTDLTPDERAELERLRSEAAHVRPAHQGWARGGRWLGAVVLLLIAALLGGLAVTAVYLRSQVLNTDTYVATVAPLAQDPAVREQIATRLTDEIMTRTNVQELATQLADKLIQEGAPSALTGLVGPAVNGLRSFLYGRILALLETDQFQTVWNEINRVAHTALVGVLTGQQGTYLQSSGNTVTIDLGALLNLAKQKLVEQGFTLVARLPDISIPYTLVESDALPKLRTYTQILNVAGTWLPWVALALFIAGVFTAPNRRRGLITGAVMLGVVALILLAALNLGRAFYLNNLPASTSQQAAADVYDTVLRYLVAALQTLLVVVIVFVVGALLAGPSRAAVMLRRWGNRGLDALAGLLVRAGRWVGEVGHVLTVAHRPVQVGVVLLAVVWYVLTNRPTVGLVLWLTVGVVVVLAVVEVFIRAAELPPPERPVRLAPA
jgi:hypothetical protein